MIKILIDDQELDMDMWLILHERLSKIWDRHINLLTILSITIKKRFATQSLSDDQELDQVWELEEILTVVRRTSFIATIIREAVYIIISLLLEGRREESTAGEKWVELDVRHGAAEIEILYCKIPICLWFCIFSSNNRIHGSLRYFRLRLVVVFFAS